VDIGGLLSHESHENINLVGTSILKDAKNTDFHILGFPSHPWDGTPFVF
jgi:hypothetical protein